MTGLCRSGRRAAAAIMLAVAAAHAQTSEYRPELDVHWKWAEHARTVLQLAGQDEESQTPHNPLVGLYQDFLFVPNGYVRGGYRYSVDTYESRPLIEVALRLLKAGSALLLTRSRVEWRWVDGKYSYRARERLQLARIPPPKGLGVAPYVMFEAFYDSRFRTIARLEQRVGSTFRLGGPATMDLYYMREDNLRGKTGVREYRRAHHTARIPEAPALTRPLIADGDTRP